MVMNQDRGWMLVASTFRLRLAAVPIVAVGGSDKGLAAVILANVHVAKHFVEMV